MLDNLRRDFAYALRTLRGSPGFTAIALVALALGIGANTAVFSVVNAILLRPLGGIRDPGRLVSIYRVQNGQTFDNLGYPDYRDYRDRNHTMSGLAAHVAAPLSFYYGRPERLIGDLVTPNYFELLGVQSAVGRLLAEDDDDAAVISYGLWQRRFGGSPGAIGAKIQLNGHPFNVVGVTERGFSGTVTSLPFDIWVPLRTQPRTLARMSNSIFENRSSGWLSLFGRLKTGESWRHADSEIKTIASQLTQAYPLTNGKRSASVAAGVGMYPDDRAEVTGLLGLLSGAVALLLLIACANVAGLLTVRASGRAREMAIRLAIGAGKARIFSQLLAEGLVLAFIAGLLGVLLAGWATEAIIAGTQGTAPSLVRHAGAQIDGTVLMFALGASVATSLLFTLLPAAHSLKIDLTSSLKSGLPGSGQRRTPLRSALVIGQVALSLVLLSGAVLLLNGLYRIVTANPGFDARNVATAAIDLNIEGYSEEKGTAFYRDLLERLRSMPGIVSASLASSIPPTEWPGAVSIFYPNQEPPRELLQAREFELGVRVNINHVSPGYFATLGIPLAAGRDFDDHDRSGRPLVAILSRALAARLWPGENPIGKRIAYPLWQGPRRPAFQVIGVAGDVNHLALTRDAPLLLYVPALQEYGGSFRVVVRTVSDPVAGIAAIQRAVAATDKNVAVYSAQTGRQHSSDSLWQQRMAAGWIGAFSFIALLLAAVGLYAVIAQSVAQRTREVGIRIALGANHRSVVALILKQGMLLALGGIVVGLPAAMVFDALVQRHLAGMNGPLTMTFAAIPALLAVVMLAACWIPAYRASHVDPMEALRSD